MRISLIVAAARNDVIGHRGEIPWRLPDDQRFFRRVTLGHVIVMGRKTFDSIGQPLPGRTNLVLSRSDRPAIADVRNFRSLADAEEWARREGTEEFFVIGGEAIYRESLDHADRIFLTRVDAEPEGDVFFPAIDPESWTCTEREVHAPDAKHAVGFAIETWLRKP